MGVDKKQIGGSHYSGMSIQPTEFIMKNDIPFAEGNVIKYVCRHGSKNGAEDIKKAIHYLELILENQYNESNILQGRLRQGESTSRKYTNSPRQDQGGAIERDDR